MEPVRQRLNEHVSSIRAVGTEDETSSQGRKEGLAVGDGDRRGERVIDEWDLMVEDVGLVNAGRIVSGRLEKDDERGSVVGGLVVEDGRRHFFFRACADQMTKRYEVQL